MTDTLVNRPRRSVSLPTSDHQLLLNAAKGAKSILEFGPGTSTRLFLTTDVERIVSCEYIDKWLKVAKEQFADEPRVEILKFTDTFPVVVEGLGDEKFDMAFVDAPKGWPIENRFKHVGYEECSRLNTVLFALERAPVVYLHDAYRPLERGTLGRLHRMGYQAEFIKPTKIGLARITHVIHPNQPDPQGVKEPGGATPGPKPKRRRVPKCKRPCGRPDCEPVSP